jgi:peptidoglycan/xylan/chitin deacetylase (PgdA/CDA1 family)
MRLFRPGLLVRLIYPRCLFRIPTAEKILFLSFDDGPESVSTENILSILRKHGIRALFFCTGKKAENHPDLMEKIRSCDHIVGNHGYQHLDGFKTPLREYCENIRQADALTSASIFRPPYGRLTPLQYLTLKDDRLIVFWDLMPYDFDTDFPARRSLDVLKRKIRSGSIIVLHDNQISSVHQYLDEFILYCLSLGYRFEIPGPANQYS